MLLTWRPANGIICWPFPTYDFIAEFEQKSKITPENLATAILQSLDGFLSPYKHTYLSSNPPINRSVEFVSAATLQVFH